MCSPNKLTVIPPNNPILECIIHAPYPPPLNTLNGARVPFISQESLLVGNFNINERVDTFRDKKMCAPARAYRRPHAGIGEIENPENHTTSKYCESLEKDNEPGKILSQLGGKKLK